MLSAPVIIVAAVAQAGEVMPRLKDLAGEWVHEGEVVVRNVIEAGPSGDSLMSRGWIDGEYHSFTQVWIAGDEVLFQSLDEQGAVARGPIRFIAPDTLEWDWISTTRDGVVSRYRILTTITGANDYRMIMYAGDADTPLMEAGFHRVSGPRDPELASYVAHVAAAGAALRLDHAADTRRWLDAAPDGLRGWEWRHLDAASDRSLGVWDTDGPGFRLDVSPDGTRVALARSDGTVTVHDLDTGVVVATLEGHEREVFSAVFSPDGSMLATASRDGTARSWDAVTGRELATLLTHERPVSSVAWSPDGTRLAVSTYSGAPPEIVGTVKILDVATAAELATLEGGDKPISEAVFTPDGAWLVAGSWAQSAFVWDIETAALLHELTVINDGEYAAVDGIAVSPDGTRLAAACKDWKVRVWDTATGDLVHTLAGHDGWVRGVVFASNGLFLASASSDGTARLWDADTGAELARLNGHTGGLLGIGYTPDGRRLVTSSADGTVRLWSAAERDYRRHVLDHGPNGAYAVACSPDGSMLASAGDNDIRLWDLATGMRTATLIGHNAPIVTLAFSPDGSVLASGSQDLTTRLWDPATGEEITTLFPRGGAVGDVAFSVDGRTLMTAGRFMRAFDLDTYDRLDTPRSEARGFAGGGRAWGIVDDAVEVFDAWTGDDIVRLPVRADAVVLSPDGKLLATGTSSGGVTLWDAVTGMVVATLAGHESNVRSLSFSPDGTRLATGSRDNTVRLWSVPGGHHLATLGAYTEWVYEVAFTPDGQRLVTCPLDGTIVIADAVPLARRLTP